MKKITILVFAVVFIALLYGCCSRSGGSGVLVSPVSDAVVIPKEVIIDELGRLPTVTFPSGASIEGAEENTLKPGIKVVVTERGLKETSAACFSDSTSDIYLYLYSISAFQVSSTANDSTAKVTTVEKPITVSISPGKSGTGLCFAGVKESSDSPWRYFALNDEVEQNNSAAASVRHAESPSFLPS